MISQRTKSVTAKCFGDVLRRCTIHAVDDARVAGMLFLDEVDKLAQRFGGLSFFSHAVTNVRAIETRNEFFGLDQKLLNDLSARVEVCRGRECHTRHLGPLLAQHRKRSVLRSKIVPPHRNAVRFVNRKEPHLDTL